MQRLNKKQCRKFAEEAWKADRNGGLFRVKSVEYVVRTAVKNVDGHRTLILFLYAANPGGDAALHPAYTVFQTREDYITLARKPDGSLTWRTSRLYDMDRRFGFTNHCAFFSKSHEQRVVRYCKSHLDKGFEALDQLQTHIHCHRERLRQWQKQRVTMAVMKAVPPMPRGVKAWLRREVMPAYVFYGRRRKGLIQGYCTACRHTVMVSPRHNAKGVCPRCGRPVQFKARGRRRHLYDRDTAVIPQRIDNQTLLLRIVKVHFTYQQDNAEQSVQEEMRIFAACDEAGTYRVQAYHSSFTPGDLTPWKPGYTPQFFSYQENFFAQTRGYLFCRDLDKELKGTPWQYCQLKTFYQQDPAPLFVQTYLEKYVQYPQLELFVNMGLYAFTTGFVFGYVPYRVYSGQTKPHRLFGIQLDQWRFLLERGLDENELALMQKLNQYALPSAQRMVLFLWCQKHQIDCYSIGEVLKHTAKFMGYVEKQHSLLRTQYGHRYATVKNVVMEYSDYLRMVKNEGRDMKHPHVLYPKDLKHAHDGAVKLILIRANREIRQAFENVLRQLNHRYDFAYGGFAIIQPACMEDIIDEGIALNHCVPLYIHRMAIGKCVILFLRRRGDIQHSFYTIELQDNQIQQVKGMENAAVTPELQAFLAVWEERVLQRQVPAAA